MNDLPPSISLFFQPISHKDNCSTPQKTLLQDDQQDSPDNKSQSPKIKSLEVLGSGIFSIRKLSAFSIYHPDEQKGFSEEQLNSHSISSDNQQSRQPTLVLKETKNSKDKRQQYRLETKNLNRFFRSKINQMLRDIRENPKNDVQFNKANELLSKLNQSNKIMFSQIREIIKDPWLQTKLTNCRAILLRYVHKGKMGMQSKLIMLKYFNKILMAIKHPDKFTCWK